MANRNATGPGLKKLRGHKKWQLIRLLASGNKTQKELGEQFGVSQATISQFNRNFADEIAAVKADLDDEFAGMWLAEKRSRVAEYEASLERSARNAELDPNPNWEKQVHTALRNVAEELGQLPTRFKVDHGDQTVRVFVEGADTDKLT